MLAVQIGAAPNKTNVPLTISISALKAEVAYGSQIGYRIVLTNHTDHKINCGDFWGEEAAADMFEITDMSGKKIAHRPQKIWSGSESRCTLDPRATESWESA
jgi:hypothetical protein